MWLVANSLDSTILDGCAVVSSISVKSNSKAKTVCGLVVTCSWLKTNKPFWISKYMISSMIVKIHWLPFGVITWTLWIKARPVKLKECFMKPLFWDHLLHVNLLSKNSSCTVAVKHSTCKLCMTCNCENVFRVLWPKSKCYWEKKKKASWNLSLLPASYPDFTAALVRCEV